MMSTGHGLWAKGLCSLLCLKDVSGSPRGLDRNLIESVYHRAFHMTLLNCGIRMLWRLQHCRAHERSRHKAPAWEICGTASACKALWAVLLDLSRRWGVEVRFLDPMHE